MIPTHADRFWAKVDRRGPDECWPWLASKNRRGYGQFRLDGKMRKAHRVAYALANGPLPHGALVCHHCDNPPCCNPHHLFSGSQAQNMQDMKSKGRRRDNSSVPRGRSHYAAKLTPEQAQAIKESTTAPAILAAELGVSRAAIHNIRKGRSWR